jgi:hypothetical protein
MGIAFLIAQGVMFAMGSHPIDRTAFAGKSTDET